MKVKVRKSTAHNKRRQYNLLFIYLLTSLSKLINLFCTNVSYQLMIFVYMTQRKRAANLICSPAPRIQFAAQVVSEVHPLDWPFSCTSWCSFAELGAQHQERDPSTSCSHNLEILSLILRRHYPNLLRRHYPKLHHQCLSMFALGIESFILTNSSFCSAFEREVGKRRLQSEITKQETWNL